MEFEQQAAPRWLDVGFQAELAAEERKAEDRKTEVTSGIVIEKRRKMANNNNFL